MPRINLLPWRTELRQRRKKEFLVALAGTLVVAMGVQIAEIDGLQAQRERLLARMQVITQLQRSRPEIVHLFDELVNAMPEGVNLIEVVQRGERVELQGVAQSSTRVSALMRNIDDSDWLRNPALDIVEAVRSGVDRNSQFKLSAQQVPMVTAEGESAQGAGK
jgi:type IV pilus assembly protein PilN